MFPIIDQKLAEFYISLGVQGDWTILLVSLTKLLLAVVLSFLAFKIAKKFIIQFFHTLARRTKSKWDDILLERKVFNRLAYLVPAYLLYLLVPWALTPYDTAVGILLLVIRIYSVVIIMLVSISFLDSILNIYQQYEISKTKPIKGYIQVGKILVYIIVSLVVISMLIGQDPLILIGGLGAFSAIVLLVFKDTILGLVAGVQLTANDMLRPGDWISMPKYEADGTVIDITLTTVKVQNWDKTISTIPAYSLFTDSFKNWRGMEESGGRRIKRSVNIDMNTITFCTPEMLEKFSKIQYLSKYIREKEIEIKKFNEARKVDPNLKVNGRRQTNIGVFRAYLREYLMNHPKINPEMTFLIRHLQPGDKGLPVEIYVFSRVQAWADYEAIQADIFDHIFAVIPEFELRVFQNPSGADFRAAFNKK